MGATRLAMTCLAAIVSAGCTIPRHEQAQPAVIGPRPRVQTAAGSETAPREIGIEPKEAVLQLTAATNGSTKAAVEPSTAADGIGSPGHETLPTYSLQDLEAMAMANNPTLQQANAQVVAAEGAAQQAGLYPNPVVGYEGEFDQIGGNPNERWNGGFVSQEFVTGSKLHLSRAKWRQRALIARTNLHAQQHRVLNDVRAQYYRALAAQETVQVHRELLANGEDNLQTHREMLNLGQTNEPGLLSAEVSVQRDRLNLNLAEAEFRHAWRVLVSLTGSSQMPIGSLAGDLGAADPPLDWDTAWARVVSASPELEAARQKIQHDKITIRREEAEPIPNLLLDVTTIQSPVADTTQTTLNVGLPLPIFDRNQGTVRQAQADLAQSHAEVRRVELDLRNRMATQFRDYESAWQRVVEFESAMLPKARRAFELLDGSYRARRAAWPDVLLAQRRWLTLKAEHIQNQLLYRESDLAIRGMLLTGGLTAPPSPVGAGHIDAVPKPR